MATILVIDDNQKLLDMLQRTLRYEGFHVLTANNGYDALETVKVQRPDLLVLDWLMPDLDGIGVVTRLRTLADEIPILMLTARDAVEHRVEGLSSGADDYLVKPFATAELLARIQALLRRTKTVVGERPLTYGDLYLNPVTRETRRATRHFDLTPTEYDLFCYLLRHPRQVLPRERILETVWGYDFEGDDNVLEVYIGYLRKKTEAAGEPRLIQTIRGVGYVLRED
ncbi:response regulator transcription factor [Candidatus Leptofilum sp.]|uniref:response regulator transcription factor n=1 Tax=Candidatus Leptofilum sp. TaxID=3241576 RepID=UPI003B5A616D